MKSRTEKPFWSWLAVLWRRGKGAGVSGPEEAGVKKGLTSPALVDAIEAKNLELVRKLINEYRQLHGGPHARLVAMQADFCDLVRFGFFEAIWTGKEIFYYPAGCVPMARRSLMITPERLEELHREELQKSATRWN